MNYDTIDYIRHTYQNSEYKRNPTGYFYDLSLIIENMRKLERFLPPQIALFYAMKANPNPQIMKCICQNGYIRGIEIASQGELDFACKYVPCDRIIFTGPGKTEFELAEAIGSRIGLINVESITEAVRINRIASALGINKVEILLRVNLNYSIDGAYEHMAGQSTKMGIDEDEYLDAYQAISTLKHVKVRGIHAFIASGVLDYRKLIKSQRYIFEFIKKSEHHTAYLPVIDFGGGLGIDYSNGQREFDIERYGMELKRMINEYGFSNKKIIMELGTYLVGNAGYYFPAER